VVERLLAEPRGVLMLLTGADERSSTACSPGSRMRIPSSSWTCSGGQPHYPLLLSAE